MVIDIGLIENSRLLGVSAFSSVRSLRSTSAALGNLCKMPGLQEQFVCGAANLQGIYGWRKSGSEVYYD